MNLSSHAARLSGPGDRERHDGRRGIERSRKSARLKIPRIDVDTASREKLIAHIDELEFIIEDLLPRREDRICEAIGVTPQQADMLSALMTGRTCTRTYLARVCKIPDPSNWSRQVDVQLMHTRRKIAPFGVEVVNTHGVGWHIPADGICRLNSIIDEEG